MKKIILPAIILLSIVSCKDSQPDKDESIIPKTTAVISTDQAQLTSVTAPAVNPSQSMPGTAVQATPVSQQINTVAQPIAPQQNISTVKPGAGLNPAHGQPGHRCDISVGAPLNSSVQKPQAPPATISKPTLISGQSTAINPAIAVNPPHGQPGHKCDVGANNNLSTGSSKAMPQTAPTLQGLPVMPQNNSAGVVSSGSNAKLNPAHGQPGHDCKVAVGQPLK